MKANNFTYGIEYEQLTGKQLLMFKNQNKSVSTYVSNIIIVYRGGLEKLEKALKCSFNLPKEISDIDESTLKELKTAEYQEIMPKTHTYIPQSSIIGRLMNHKE